jgi:hypothetical protein
MKASEAVRFLLNKYVGEKPGWFLPVLAAESFISAFAPRRNSFLISEVSTCAGGIELVIRGNSHARTVLAHSDPAASAMNLATSVG